MQEIRTLGEFVAEEQIVVWLREEVSKNHLKAASGAKQIARHHKLPMHCTTCTASKTCCESYVIVRLYEGLLVADALKRTARDTPELRDQLRVRAAAMEAARPGGWITPCLFLDPGERCTIYEVRPVNCAQLYVYTPPALCNARSTGIRAYTASREIEHANKVEEVFRERLSLRRKVGRRYLGVLPRMVLVSLEAWDRTDFRDYLRQLPWMTDAEWSAVVDRDQT